MDEVVDTPEAPEAAVPLSRQAWRQALAQVAEDAKATLPGCEGRIAQAVQILLAGDVTLHADGRATVGSQSEAETIYTVTAGVCPCPDAARAPITGWCKHKLAWALYKRALPLTEQRVEQAVGTGEGATPPERSLIVPAHWLVPIQGKQHVLYAGLLSLAHQQGLRSLEAQLVTVTAERATATATARFADGRCFTEAADATPDNVGSRIKPHYPRMALTRAKARALRDALNLGDLVAAEEVGEG